MITASAFQHALQLGGKTQRYGPQVCHAVQKEALLCTPWSHAWACSVGRCSHWEWFSGQRLGGKRDGAGSERCQGSSPLRPSLQLLMVSLLMLLSAAVCCCRCVSAGHHCAVAVLPCGPSSGVFHVPAVRGVSAGGRRRCGLPGDRRAHRPLQAVQPHVRP